MVSKRSVTPRDRLLRAANKLFYAEGIHTVGIDRVIEEAGVAKASLYSTFGSKDELVRAYLEGRFELRRTRVEATLARHARAAPRTRLLALFDMQGALFAEPGFRGCAFARANAEGTPAPSTSAVCADFRAYMRGVFLALCREAAAGHADRLAVQLLQIHDGATASAQLDHEPVVAAAAARDAAATLFDAATR